MDAAVDAEAVFGKSFGFCRDPYYGAHLCYGDIYTFATVHSCVSQLVRYAAHFGLYFRTRTLSYFAFSFMFCG